MGLIVGLCLAGASVSPASAAVPQPKVVGNQIIDTVTGDQFVPRGVNWPSFEYACEGGWGYSSPGGDSTHGILSDETNADRTATAMAAWKINTVRIPLNQNCWLGDNGLPASDLFHNLTPVGYQVAVLKFVEALNRQGIVAILDLHWTGPGGTRSDGQPKDGLRNMADERSDDFWSSVATTFKNNRSVIFDLFNEPHSRDFNYSTNSYNYDLTWAKWQKGGLEAPVENDTAPVGSYTGSTFKTIGMNQLVTAVRQTGATQPIILSGRDYANDLTGWLAHKPADAQLIAGFHNYPGQICDTPSCWSEEISPVASVVPVLTSEFGQKTCDVDPQSHMAKYMQWADNRSIGYLAWAWWALPSAPGSCEDFALITDDAGIPKAPVGTAFRDHLVYVNIHPTTGTPDNPGPGEDPDGPKPAKNTKRGKAKLKIVKSKFRNGKLRFKVRTVSGATGKVKVRVFVTDAKRQVKSSTDSARLKGGSAHFSFTIRGDFSPTRIVARYSGNQKFKPDRTQRRIGS